MTPFEYIKFRKIDEKSIQMLTTGECFYSSPNNFNDPLDCTHSLEGFPPSILDGLRKVLEKDKYSVLQELESAIYKKLRRIDNGVVSFCGRHASDDINDPILSPNLWGHYANDHKGICIGFSPINSYDTFDFSSALNPTKVGNGRRFSVPTQPGGNNLLVHVTTRPHKYDNLLSPDKDAILKVKYVNNFSLPNPNWNKVIENYETDETIIESSSSDEIMHKLLNDALDIKQVVSHKHKNWSTENEYRLFGDRDKSQAIGAAISSITFGLNTSNSAIRYITSIIARFYGVNIVELHKMIIIKGVLTRIPFEMNDAMPSSSHSHLTF